MISRLEIERFKGIREGKIDGLGQLALFTGINGSGKTTILDALRLCCSKRPGEVLREIVNRHRDLWVGAQWLAFRRTHEQATLTITTHQKSQVRFINFDYKKVSSHLESLSISFESDQEYDGPVLLTRLSANSQGKIESDPGTNDSPISPLVLLEPKRGVQILEIWSEAIRKGRRAQLQASLKTILPGLQVIEILVEEGRPGLYATFSDYSVPIELSGDGNAALLRIAVELAAMDGGLALIEEPEAFQHPAAMRQTAQVIWEAITRGIQVIVSTHSLDIIDNIVDQAPADQPDLMSLHAMKLEQGKLTAVRYSQEDVIHSRRELENDLR